MDSLTSGIHRDAWAKLRMLYAKIYQTINARVESTVECEMPSIDHICEELKSQLNSEVFTLQLSLEEHYELSNRRDAYLWRLGCLLLGLREYFSKKDVDGVRVSFERLAALCDEYSVDIWSYYEDIEGCLDELEVSESEIIYLPKQTLIELPKLILEVHYSLIRQIANNPDLLFHISPRKFEEVIAELFFKKGFHVELTKATRDGGKDIIAVYEHMDIKTKYIIECKRYASTNKVSLELVQRLLGVKFSERANKAILATTSTFTRDARTFARNHFWDLDLKDYDDIVSWIKAY